MTRDHDAFGSVAPRGAIGRFALAAAVALLLAAVPSAAPGVTIPLSIESMAALSDAVVIARVASTSARQVPSKEIGEPPSVVTDVVLSVERSLKGARGATVRLSVDGGTAGGIVMVSDESPRFAIGERCALFLDGSDRIVGGSRGKAGISGDQVPSEGLALDAFIARVNGTAMPGGGLRAATVPDLVAGGTLVTAAYIPVITSITPPGRPAGTLSMVTISGTGFGAAQGRVYFAGEGGSRILAPLVSGSWTDTSVVCVVPAGADSGAVTLTAASFARSAGYDYTVGFSWAGLYWDGARMPYYLYSEDAARRAWVTQALDAWNSVSASHFQFALETTTSVAHNDIEWSAAYPTASTILAQNHYWYDSMGRLLHSDITFNALQPWGDGVTGGYSVARVAAHELGHSLSLADQYGDGDLGKLMYWATSHHQVFDGIPTTDADGLRWIYDPDFTGADPAADPSSLVRPAPVGTSLSIGYSPRRPRVRKWMTLYGAVGPGAAGDAVVVQMRKPRSRKWVSVAVVSAGENGAWSWRYIPRLRGTFYFRAYYGGAVERYGSWSRTISVRVR
jgi:hypothetical protein